MVTALSVVACLVTATGIAFAIVAINEDDQRWFFPAPFLIMLAIFLFCCANKFAGYEDSPEYNQYCIRIYQEKIDNLSTEKAN